MSDILEMPLDLLRAALPAVSGEETRYYLRGIYFDPAGWIAATATFCSRRKCQPWPIGPGAAAL